MQQTGFIARACRSNPPAPGVDAIRMPGEQGLARKRQALAAGLSRYPGIMRALEPWAKKLKVALPAPAG